VSELVFGRIGVRVGFWEDWCQSWFLGGLVSATLGDVAANRETSQSPSLRGEIHIKKCHST
jgi:hypothetical protein